MNAEKLADALRKVLGPDHEVKVEKFSKEFKRQYHGVDKREESDDPRSDQVREEDDGEEERAEQRKLQGKAVADLNERISNIDEARALTVQLRDSVAKPIEKRTKRDGIHEMLLVLQITTLI